MFLYITMFLTDQLVHFYSIITVACQYYAGNLNHLVPVSKIIEILFD